MTDSNTIKNISLVATEFTCGFLAGSVSKTLVAPLERIKLILQNQQLFLIPEKLKYKGTLDALRRIPAEQGFFSFWRGNGTNVLRIIPSCAIRFSSYDALNRFLHKKGEAERGWKRAMRKLGFATISSLFTTVFTYPLDVVRTRLSLDVSKESEPRLYRGTLGCTREIFKSEGLAGFYKGFGIACLGIVPYLSLSLATYDLLKPDIFNADINDSRSFLNLIVSYFGLGTVAGMSAQIVTYPLDTVRRRMQLNGAHGLRNTYKNSADCIRKMLRTEGMKGFYRGLLPNLIKIPPAAAIQFSMYDLFKYQFLGNIEHY